ncbi:MAG TPA: hypothetical protein VF230_06930 [Acidimicrobiales bacterium]
MSRRRASVVALALAAVLVIVTGACGGKDGDRDAASAKKAGAGAEADADAKVGAASAEADADAKADSSTKPKSGASATDSKGDVAPIPGSASGDGATTATTNPPISTDALKNDFIFGSPAHRNADDPRPPNCLFKVGEACRFRVHGTYGLKSQDVASIHVGAYDDGASEAAFSVSLPNARKGGSQWFVDKFFYQARPGTKYTEVLVKLIDGDGKVLATGQPTRFDIQA